ncbi:MAG: SCO family protein [Alphaproteobacteria bacterium]|nr:SCO family protein [Alphaproteobacteria bacterium]
MKRWRSTLLAVGAVVVLGGIGAVAWRQLSEHAGNALTAIGGPFSLTDGQGHTVTDRDLRGRYMLVYFGYTFCPDVCPTTLAAMAGALEKLGKTADRIAPVFITVDPSRDTPKVMHDYVAAFSPRIIGLTGTPEQITQVTREYRVYVASHRSREGGNYTVDHSSILYLMGPDGRFIAPLRTDTTADQMAGELVKLVSGASS